MDSRTSFWVVTRHEEVKEVSQRSDIFSTHENTAIPRFADDIPRENVEMQRFILINKDAPEHTKLRKLVSRGFTPRAINSLREELTERAEKIVTTAAAAVPVTSWFRSRPNFRCRQSPSFSVCRRKIE